ncbi:aspartate-semialdehyde dehydrogenase [Candidatus Poribacteria bacterium]|nr:aspartate-semialdehyde dehydrogenase [Candidatus Poribacteria bacterium]
MAKLSAAILGPTGMAGQQFMPFLAEHPYFELKILAASERSAGKSYKDAAKWYQEKPIPSNLADMPVVSMEEALKKAEVDIVFSALPSKVAEGWEPKFAEKGMTVFSDAGCFRDEPDVPVIIPEVNYPHLKLLKIQQSKRGWQGGIVKNPNCTTVAAAMALAPLRKYGIKRVNLASMQAVSGAGYDGVPSMAILDNVIPYIEGEEEKVEYENLKILGELDESKGEVNLLPAVFSASCHRVCTINGHIEALFVEFENDVEIEDLRQSYLNFTSRPQELDLPTAPKPPVVLFDDPYRPQVKLDRNLGNGMAASVGRIRHDKDKHRIKLIALAHNTVRGAAGNLVLAAELALKDGLI